MAADYATRYAALKPGQDLWNPSEAWSVARRLVPMYEKSPLRYITETSEGCVHRGTDPVTGFSVEVVLTEGGDPRVRRLA